MRFKNKDMMQIIFRNEMDLDIRPQNKENKI